MKYIKLFESWLNEADTNSKLDPKKPDSTLVVDITVGDIKQNQADVKNIYASIFKKFEFNIFIYFIKMLKIFFFLDILILKLFFKFN